MVGKTKVEILYDSNECFVGCVGYIDGYVSNNYGCAAIVVVNGCLLKKRLDELLVVGE